MFYKQVQQSVMGYDSQKRATNDIYSRTTPDMLPFRSIFSEYIRRSHDLEIMSHGYNGSGKTIIFTEYFPAITMELMAV